MIPSPCRPRVVLIGPDRRAVGGISTHVDLLLRSTLADSVELAHFLVGSDGRPESGHRKALRLATNPLAFLRFLIAWQPNIVHLNTSMVPKAFWRDVLYVFIARIAGCRVICQVHGGALPQEFCLGRPLASRVFTRMVRASKALVLLARSELDAYRRFMPQARFELIANAVDQKTMELHVAKPERPLHLVYMGRLIEEKGVFDAVEALAILVRDKRSVRLTVAGGGPEESELRARVLALGLAAYVDFAGSVFDSRKDALWRAAHVFLFPTYFVEGLPYALLEAMAAGAVPVTTRVGAIPDVIEDEVHGVFVPPRQPAALAAAVARLDEDRETLTRMSQAGRQRVIDQYTLVRLASDFRRLYSSVLEA